MKCCVRTCTNTDKMRKSSNYRVTFHLFPKDPKQRAAWIEALGMKDWSPNDRTIICSDHFRPEDLHNNKSGSRRIVSGAVPVIINENLECPAVERTCKICLALDVKMYQMTDVYQMTNNINNFQLEHMYENITGILACDNDRRMPGGICWECAARLTAAANFRAKALLSDGLLRDILKNDSYIKVGDIIYLNRRYSALKSSLTIQNQLKTEEICYDETQTVKEEEIRNENDIEKIDLNEMEGRVKDEDEIAFVLNENLNDTVKTEVVLIPNEIDIQIPENNDTIEELIHLNNEQSCDEKNETEIEIQKVFDDEFDDRSSIELFKEDDEVVKINDDDGDVMASEVFVHINNIQEVPVKKKKTAKKEKAKNKESGSRRRNSKKPFKRARQPIDENIFTIVTLTTEELIQEVEKRRDSVKYKLAPYKCAVCFKGFPTEDKYNRHAFKHDEQSGTLQCVICKIRCKKSWAMRAHMTKQHSEEFRCKLCPLITRSRTVALAHVKFHDGTKYECPQCFIEFEKKTTLLNHIRLKHISGFVCELCGYTFVSKMGVRSHKRMKHPLIEDDIKLEGPYCKVCDVKFLSKKAYDKHLRLSAKHIESEDDPNRLSNDPAIKSRRIGLVRKRAERRPTIHPRNPDDRMLQPNDPVDCEQCGIELPNLHAYACHFKTDHPGINRTKYPYSQNPYMCDQCGKMFLNTTSLENHMWVHTGEKRYQCDHCHKMFSVKANLAGHMRLHDATRRSYACRVCGKLFAFSFNRTRHMFLHTGLKPFKCDACEKCFVTSGELRAHVDHVHLKKPRPKRVRRKPRKCDITGVEY